MNLNEIKDNLQRLRKQRSSKMRNMFILDKFVFSLGYEIPALIFALTTIFSLMTAASFPILSLGIYLLGAGSFIIGAGILPWFLVKKVIAPRIDTLNHNHVELDLQLETLLRYNNTLEENGDRVHPDYLTLMRSMESSKLLINEGVIKHPIFLIYSAFALVANKIKGLFSLNINEWTTPTHSSEYADKGCEQLIRTLDNYTSYKIKEEQTPLAAKVLADHYALCASYVRRSNTVFELFYDSSRSPQIRQYRSLLRKKYAFSAIARQEKALAEITELLKKPGSFFRNVRLRWQSRQFDIASKDRSLLGTTGVCAQMQQAIADKLRQLYYVNSPDGKKPLPVDLTSANPDDEDSANYYSDIDEPENIASRAIACHAAAPVKLQAPNKRDVSYQEEPSVTLSERTYLIPLSSKTRAAGTVVRR